MSSSPLQPKKEILFIYLKFPIKSVGKIFKILMSSLGVGVQFLQKTHSVP